MIFIKNKRRNLTKMRNAYYSNSFEFLQSLPQKIKNKISFLIEDIRKHPVKSTIKVLCKILISFGIISVISSGGFSLTFSLISIYL